MDLERTYDCEASECLAPYFDFPDEFAEHARPVSDEEIEEQLAAALDAPEPEPTGLRGEALREAVLDVLNIGFLVDGWLADLVVTRIREEDHGTYTERELLLEDPAIGTVEALLFVPGGAEEPLPAIVGLHGHGETKDVFVDAYMGRRLAEAGFVVLVPTLRVHNCSADENAVAIHLLRHGFTLMGLRAYEALLMARYQKAQPWVAPDRIGLYSHSGGSSTANLVVRISGCFAAQVTDYVQDYRNTCGPDDIHCETMPAMFPLSADVNDPSTLPIPRMKVPYAFEEPALRDNIEAFFEEHLR
ncbi:MAG: alpha/beta hydrolase family protein [Myxococcota bacterium]